MSEVPLSWPVPKDPDWPTCFEPGCIGVQISRHDRCLAHLSDADRADVLGYFAPDFDVDCRGVSFTGDLLQQLLEAVEAPDGRGYRFGICKFDHATFAQDAGFTRARFHGEASFHHAIFNGAARFDRTRFEKNALFSYARFIGEAIFVDSVFGGNAGFNPVDFGAEVDFGRARFDGEALFASSRFASNAGFDRTMFLADAQFQRVKFAGEAAFSDGRFAKEAGFTGVTFGGDAQFSRRVFSGDAEFGGAEFEGTSTFAKVQFRELARLTHTKFAKDAHFYGTTFDGKADFDGAEFRKLGRFANAKFAGAISFVETIFRKQAIFHQAILGDGSHLGPLTAALLDLTDVRVGKGVRVQCLVEDVMASNVHCPDGLNLQIGGGIHFDAARIHSAALTFNYRAGQLTLTDAAFGSPTTIAAPAATERTALTLRRQRSATPRLLGLERVDATNLTLVGLDLAACRFVECYNRDYLRIDGPPEFARQPTRRTHRHVLAEEHMWRARFGRHPHGWFPEECRHPGEAPPPNTPGDRNSDHARDQAARLQTVYRDLRKGREDAKDEPGAADFYYGEMEMRRLAAPPLSAERVLLTAYWLISGYGQRASRALAALLALLILGSISFATVGFASASRTEYRPVLPNMVGQLPVYRQVAVATTRPGWAAAIDQSIDSATALLRTNQPRPLTVAGRVTEIALRLLGPLLLGLAILAVRGRVKR